MSEVAGGGCTRGGEPDRDPVPRRLAGHIRITVLDETGVTVIERPAATWEQLLDDLAREDGLPGE